MAQPVRADQRGMHAVPGRDRYVVVQVVPGEQHLPGRAPGGGEHDLVKQRLRLSYAERIGKDRSAEQVVDPGLLERRPPCLAWLSAAGQDQAQSQIIVQDAQRRCRRRVDRFLPDQVVKAIEGISSRRNPVRSP